jgi:nicotinamide mononucleotide transporter
MPIEKLYSNRVLWLLGAAMVLLIVLWPDSWDESRRFEAIAAFVNFLSVALTARQNIWCWPIGILGSALFIIMFFEVQLYADVLLQFFFIALGFYGWWRWLRGAQNTLKHELPVSRTPRVHAIVLGLIAVCGTAAMGAAFHNFTDAAMPYWDSTINVLSVLATWMLARKYLESWLVWVTVDIIAIGVYWCKDLKTTSALYALFLCIAASGYFAWCRTMMLESKAAIRI